MFWRCFLNENRLPGFWKRVFQISFLAKHLWNKVYVGLNHHWSDFHQFFYSFPSIFGIWKENHTLKAEIERFFLLLPIDNVRLDAIALLRVWFFSSQMTASFVVECDWSSNVSRDVQFLDEFFWNNSEFFEIAVDFDVESVWDEFSQMIFLWQVFVNFTFFTVDTSSTLGVRMASFGKTWLKDHFFNWESVEGTCLNLTISNELLLFESWCIISKSVNHFFDHDSKCHSGSLISSDSSECVAKIPFACSW